MWFFPFRVWGLEFRVPLGFCVSFGDDTLCGPEAHNDGQKPLMRVKCDPLKALGTLGSSSSVHSLEASGAAIFLMHLMVGE